jgi:hypothetical protein
MSLYDTILATTKSTLIQSLSEYPDTQVIYRDESGAEPKRTYATVYLLSLEQTGGTTTSSRLDEDLTYYYQTPYEATVQYSFYGKDAPSIAYSSHMRMANSVLNRESSQASNMSIIRKSPVRRIPQKRDTKYVEMCTYDVTYSFISGFTQVLQPIEQVVIEDTIQDVVISIPADITP